MLSASFAASGRFHVNVEIMRAFVRVRQLLTASAELTHRLDGLESRYDAQFNVVSMPSVR